MANMQLPRLANLCLVYKIKDLLENNIGLSSANYQVRDGYPNEQALNETIVWPLVSVEFTDLFGRDVELGSESWPVCQVAIDVFARTDTQRDDITYILWKELNDLSLVLYNFNSAFPTVVGDYTGIPSLGSFGVANMSYQNVIPEVNSPSLGERHHSIIDGYIELPNI